MPNGDINEEITRFESPAAVYGHLFLAGPVGRKLDFQPGTCEG